MRLHPHFWLLLTVFWAAPAWAQQPAPQSENSDASATSSKGTAMAGDTSAIRKPLPEAGKLPSPLIVATQCPAKPRILSIENLSRPGVSPLGGQQLHLGDYVRLRVSHLRRALDAEPTKPKPDKLRLFIDQVPVRGLPPVELLLDGNCDPDTVSSIIFQLRRDSASERVWRIFYRVPGKYEHPAQVQVGYDDRALTDAFPAREARITLKLVQQWGLWLGLGFVLALGVLLWWLGTARNLLRNTASKLTPSPLVTMTQPNTPGTPSAASFSLAKSQLALWTFLIVSAYLMCYMVTGELPRLTDTTLALLGVSLGQRFLSRGIDLRQDRLVENRHQDLPTQGFFWDIITDETGPILPRIQFVAFNLIIGYAFLRYVYKEWALPEFSNQTFVLLTISGAGYLSVKTQENGNPTDPAPPVAPPPVAPPPGGGTRVAPPPPQPSVDGQGTPSARADEQEDRADPTGATPSATAPDAGNPPAAPDAAPPDPNRALG